MSKCRVPACVLLAFAAPLLTHGASAQQYPTKAVRFLIPYATGGATDILGRIVAQKLSERMGQQFVIDNRPGASATLATDLLAKSPPDGYTIMTANIAHAANPFLYRKLPYDTLTDFLPVSLMVTIPTVLIVHPSLPVRTTREFVALAKSRPGQLAYGGAGLGTANHLPMELFKQSAKVDILHVPYKGGGPALTDLIGGQIQAMFITIPPSQPHIRAGKVRALGLSSAKRSAALPEVPTIAESGLPGFEGYEWQGILVPKGTPAAIVERLSREIVTVLNLPDAKERIAGLGADIKATDPAGFADFIRREMDVWGRVIREGNIRAD